MEKVELNSQELNLNLISLDKFEQLPQVTIITIFFLFFFKNKN